MAAPCARCTCDHRIGEMICEIGNPDLFPELEIPRSSIRSMVTSNPAIRGHRRPGHDCSGWSGECPETKQWKNRRSIGPHPPKSAACNSSRLDLYVRRSAVTTRRACIKPYNRHVETFVSRFMVSGRRWKAVESRHQSGVTNGYTLMSICSTPAICSTMSLTSFSSLELPPLSPM